MLQSAQEILRRRTKSDKRMLKIIERFTERSCEYLRICHDSVQFILEVVAERKVDNEDTCNGRAECGVHQFRLAYNSTVSVSTMKRLL